MRVDTMISDFSCASPPASCSPKHFIIGNNEDDLHDLSCKVVTIDASMTVKQYDARPGRDEIVKMLFTENILFLSKLASE